MRDIRWMALAAVAVMACGAPVIEDPCGPGTVLRSGKCEPDLTTLCGAGTEGSSGRCTALPAEGTVRCGAGTALSGEECLATLSCGGGTVESEGKCVPVDGLSCGPGTTVEGTHCVPSDPLTCGSGTTRSGSQCIASTTLSCGSGTAQVGSVCKPDLGVVCGTDTVAANNGTTCVSSLSCSTGTKRQSNACVADTAVVCGAGTKADGGKCVVDEASVCGAGTTYSNGQCVPTPPNPTLTTFSGATNLKTSFYEEYIGASSGYELRAVITDLNQSGADAWAEAEASMVGQGAAVHLVIDTPSSIPSTGLLVTVDDASGSGSCSTLLDPSDEPGPWNTTYVNFFQWNGASPSVVACSEGGSIKIERDTTVVPNQVKMTFNVQFSDGTLWQDRVFTATHRAE